MNVLHQSFIETHKIPLNDRYAVASSIFSGLYGIDRKDVYDFSAMKVTNICQRLFLTGFYYEQCLHVKKSIETILEAEFLEMWNYKIIVQGVTYNGFDKFINSEKFAVNLFNKGRDYYKQTSLI